MENNNYPKFFTMLAVSFVIMYAVMFLNVDNADHIYLSLTRFYMTLLMVSPMALTMLLFMQKMYDSKKRNTFIYIGSIIVFILALTFLRNQVPISDRQYMKAMIPHHSSAIMTSQAADIKDPEVRKLADGIIKSQKEEIARMKAILDRMERENR
ncbi:DUF305 domain-containing protein [Dyadobacter pollutisoli]|uniref:DUF305 domain-containing protein n=1 Tax=Dyadobacter pollutisoli TaxID=2910158 RepID=A0A9E8NHV4_9BACT|nr:DUF305 domain-containing protein [Dyadobacter pollutisoli]WAC14951.1 DUF305 domain-containing protein [Dyadobacter pollutisoli]